MWRSGAGGAAVPGAPWRGEDVAEEAAEGHQVKEEEAGRDGDKADAEGWKGEADGGEKVEEELERKAGAVEGMGEKAGIGGEDADEDEGASEAEVFVGDELPGEAVFPGEEP